MITSYCGTVQSTVGWRNTSENDEKVDELATTFDHER